MIWCTYLVLTLWVAKFLDNLIFVVSMHNVIMIICKDFHSYIGRGLAEVL